MFRYRPTDYGLGVILALELAHHCLTRGCRVDQIEEILRSERLEEALNATFDAGLMVKAVHRGFTETLRNLVDRTAVATYPHSPKYISTFLLSLEE